MNRHQAMLVSDDQTLLSIENEKLIAKPPPSIAGLLEIHGVGLVRVPYRRRAVITTVLQLDDSVERLPEPKTYSILGITLPLFTLPAQNSDLDLITLSSVYPSSQL
jgi:HPr kinase/phosphorylase